MSIFVTDRQVLQYYISRLYFEVWYFSGQYPVFARFDTIKGMAPIVVKTGTNVLTTSSGRLDLNNVRYLVDQIADLMGRGVPVIWVSSGAITCGAQKLSHRPESTEEKQMAASVGQIVLMSEYARFFDQKGQATTLIVGRLGLLTIHL